MTPSEIQQAIYLLQQLQAAADALDPRTTPSNIRADIAHMRTILAELEGLLDPTP